MRGRRICLVAGILLGLLACKEGQSSEDAMINVQASPQFQLHRAERTGLAFPGLNKLHPQDLSGLLSGGASVAIGDINGDSLPDVLISGGYQNSRLFLNQGQLRFVDITAQANLKDSGPNIAHTEGVNLVDVNGDGWLDIYLVKNGLETKGNGWGAYGRNLLYINQQNGSFQEEGKAFGLDIPGLGTAAHFFDYDRDGDLDVYLAHTPDPGSAFNLSYYDKTPPDPVFSDQLLENQAGKRFVNVSRNAGLLSARNLALSVSVADINQDGWLDIYVANDFFGRDFLYLHNGKKGFQEVGREYFTQSPMSAMGSDFADVDGDGWLDLFVGEMMPADPQRQKMNVVPFSLEMYAQVAQKALPQYPRNMLLHNQKGAAFRDVGELAGVEATEWSWSSFFFDADNDGRMDLFVPNGIRRDMTNMDFVKNSFGNTYTDMANPAAQAKAQLNKIPSVKTPNFLFQNQGEWNFSNKAPAWGLGQAVHTRGAGCADFDRDGDLDLLLINIEESPYLYENLNPQQHASLRVRLEGKGGNTWGIGAEARSWSNGHLQVHTLSEQRGFQSGPEAILHIGLGLARGVDSLEIRWPTGQQERWYQLSSSQLHYLQEGQGRRVFKATAKLAKTSLFAPITDAKTPQYRHQESPFVDFRQERLLHRACSREGPGIAFADVNGDGQVDMYLGGARGSKGELWLANSSGKGFRKGSSLPGSNLADMEEQGVLFFDADQDGDQDLYIASGSYEFGEDDPAQRDRLFLNQGQGQFQEAADALPTDLISSSCVVAGDYDKDGDWDLFVGGRISPGQYSEIPRSRILRNEGGRFQDVTQGLAPELAYYGRISSALWTDVDQDGQLDLGLVGEWLPLSFFKQGVDGFQAWVPPGAEQSHGWWNSLTSADLDQDGDLDYVLGNFGLNTRFKPSPTQPLRWLSADFDQNGQADPLLFYPVQGELMPFVNRDLFCAQMPGYNRQFFTFESFAKVRYSNLFDAAQLAEAEQAVAYEMRSGYFEQKAGTWQFHPFPASAQMGPVYGVLVEDWNADGYLDMLLGGNAALQHFEMGPNDALVPQILWGDGQGNFHTDLRSYPFGSSSLELRAMGLIPNGPKGEAWLVAAENNGPLHLRRWLSSAVWQAAPAGTRVARIHLNNGQSRLQEFYLGQGYLSQLPAGIWQNSTIASVEWIGPDQ